LSSPTKCFWPIISSIHFGLSLSASTSILNHQRYYSKKWLISELKYWGCLVLCYNLYYREVL
jgi:hypothetical protein